MTENAQNLQNVQVRSYHAHIEYYKHETLVHTLDENCFVCEHDYYFQGNGPETWYSLNLYDVIRIAHNVSLDDMVVKNSDQYHTSVFFRNTIVENGIQYTNRLVIIVNDVTSTFDKLRARTENVQNSTLVSLNDVLSNIQF